jgi:hypothetical protein
MGAPETTPAAAAPAAAVGATTETETEDRRPKPSTKVLAEARKRGRVIVHPSAEDVAANPGARGYDVAGLPKPADARAVFLVVPKPVDPTEDPTPEDRGLALRKTRKAAAAAREKARREAEKAEG